MGTGKYLIVLIAFLYECQAKTDLDISVKGGNNLTIGVLVPWEKGWTVGASMGSAIVVALDTVERLQLIPGYDINFELRDDYCEATRGLKV